MGILKFLDIDSNEWDHVLLSIPHDFHHRREYMKISLSPGESGGAYYVEDNDSKFFLPFIKSPFELAGLPTVYDAFSAYGYSSPIFLSNSDPGEQKSQLYSACRQVIDALRAQSITSMFVRLHPLFPLSCDVLEKFGSLVLHGRTVSVDLAKPEDGIWRSMDGNDRRRIKKLLSAGCTCSVDADWSLLDEFVTIYTETMQRLKTSPFYFFTRDYFLKLRSIAPEKFHLVVVKSSDQRVMWGGIFSEFNGIVQFHLSGTANAFLNLNPTKLALNFVRQWARARGNRVLHLGGGVGGREDELFAFKRRLGTDLHPFYTWRVIVSPERYNQYVIASQKKTGLCPDPSFFPPYRQKP